MSIPGHFSAGVKVPVNGSSSVNAKVASTASSNLTSNTPSTTLHTSSTASTATNVNVSSTSNSSAAPATTNNINVNNATKGQATYAAMKFMFIFVFMIRCLKQNWFARRGGSGPRPTPSKLWEQMLSKILLQKRLQNRNR